METNMETNMETKMETNMETNMESNNLFVSLARLKLLDALKGNNIDKLDSLLKEFSPKEITIKNVALSNLKELVLHYAVQIAPLSTIQYLLENSVKYGIDLNSHDSMGNTPLHIAVVSLRVDVVSYLLSLPNINDTLLNLNKKQAIEMTNNLNIIQLMLFEKAKFIEKHSQEVREYFLKRNFSGLERVLVNNARAAALININTPDTKTGNTILHEAIKNNDFEMCEWILKNGGDSLKRDKHGKLPIDLVHSNDAIKKLIKKSSKNQDLMCSIINKNFQMHCSLPTYSGYLKKWTNIASGYKLRYFILDQNNVLSYYANQDSTSNLCKGSLNLFYASVHLDSSDQIKFEIIGKNSIKWYLKTNYSTETNRWVWILQNSIRNAKDKSRKLIEKPFSADSIKGIENNHNEYIMNTHVDFSIDKSLKTNYSQKSNNKTTSKFHPSSSNDKNENAVLDNQLSAVSIPIDIISSELSDFDVDDDDENIDIESENSTQNQHDQIHSLKTSITLSFESLFDLFSQMIKSFNIENFEKKNDLNQTIVDAFDSIKTNFNDYTNQVQINEAKLKRKLKRQSETNILWENSIRQLDKEIREREQKLSEFENKTTKLKMYLDNTIVNSRILSHSENNQKKNESDGSDKNENIKNEKEKEMKFNTSLTQDDLNAFKDLLNDTNDIFFDALEYEPKNDNDGNKNLNSNNVDQLKSETNLDTHIDNSNKSAIHLDDDNPFNVVEADNNEECLDDNNKIIDSNNSIIKINLEDYNESQKKVAQDILDQKSFAGYENLHRTKLPVDKETRPKIGLWGILKSMIGQDMTKMTLPITLNEPTSLLQRLSEDLEYAYLLNKAAEIDDSTLRMVYISTFAASEYSSTINRIAKPFNPLLGETFEYFSIKDNYRLIIEQVSHHPPISACFVESPKWTYYGENAINSQFRGRSFDFKHEGRMFCILKPDKPVIDLENNEVYEEIYSWKKINTSIIGIVVGNPAIDNFGRMEVRNHTTGDVSIIDFKQRSWISNSAYQLMGKVCDKHNNPQWAVGGHWNSKIFAKKIDKLNNDTKLSDLIHEENDSRSYSNNYCYKEIFLVWMVKQRPQIAFNLTSFAVNLNAINDELKLWLPQTETRLRTDQRHLEFCNYNEATAEKHRLEEKQRSTKKKRDLEKLKYKPSWFTKEVHPITNDLYWKYNGLYWETRYKKEFKKNSIF